MMQGFEWHVPPDQRHWKRLRNALPSLKDIGVDNIWIPPGCKGMDPTETGYDIYDMYDLGEFYQKGSRATRWGSKEALQGLFRAARNIGIGIYWDTVLNHKAGADYKEKFAAVKVNPKRMFLSFEIIRPRINKYQNATLRYLNRRKLQVGLGSTSPAGARSTVI